MKADDHCFAFKFPALSAWMQPVCNPAWGKETTRQRLILAAMATAWFAIVLAIIWHHEFWRDEVRALSIAIAPPSLWDLPEFLKNEGHPVVWYMLLRISYRLLGNSALPVVSLLAAGAAVMIFLFRSPFSLGLKFLFVFSVLPLYEYSVMARNYGISMLLMFSFAAIYPYRRRYLFVLTVLLALLTNTNVHALLIAGVLTVLWLWDEMVVDRQSLSTRRLSLLGLSASLIFATALFSVKTVLPDERTIVTHALYATSLKDYLDPFLKILLRPWEPMGKVITLGALLVGLTIRTHLALGLLAAFLAMGYLFNFAYAGSLRHKGIFLIFVFVLYWLNIEQGQSLWDSLTARLNTLALVVVLPLVLLWGDYLAFSKVRQDFQLELSSCKALGEWLNSRSEYQNAIILGEPDYALEALPYYAAQRIFIPRESRFGTWVHFTTEARPVISLGQLLNAAQSLKEKEHQTVLVALGFPASDFEQNSFKAYSYNKMLTWTPSEWQRFRQSTRRVAKFWSSKGDENFDLYEIR